MDIWRCGYLDASMKYSDTEGRAKIATLRFEKIARFSQNQDKMQKNENLTVFEAVAADAVLYADALLEELEKTEKKL
jgi:hypothetical protein